MKLIQDKSKKLSFSSCREFPYLEAMSDNTLLHRTALGFPRIGENRELKRALEKFWSQKSSAAELEKTARELRARHWKTQSDAGLDSVPCNDFSLYDQVLDTSCLLGNVPARFGPPEEEISLDTYFTMARGNNLTAACEMTKWFDTNYHYLVPEFSSDTQFRLADEKVFREFAEAKALGHQARPVLLGPLSYLHLGKAENVDRWELLDSLVAVYEKIISRLAAEGAEWIQLDEPILSLDLPPEFHARFQKVYQKLVACGAKIFLANYFGELGSLRDTVFDLPVHGLHLDLVRGPADLEPALENWPAERVLSLGLVNGRNIWINNLAETQKIIQKARTKRAAETLWLAPSCSLLHVPHSLRRENQLAPELRPRLAFAEEKLQEISLLAAPENASDFAENSRLHAEWSQLSGWHRPQVRDDLQSLLDSDFQRTEVYQKRRAAQERALDLPLIPTTTIGSFPQTKEVRRWRAQWKKGELSKEQYEENIRAEITACIRRQEEIGLDLLVHGEFERNDMVEFFGEQLDGFAFTRFGWVQSYGSRCVKPPLLFGDVERKQAMTVKETTFANSLGDKPVKGMLTGPVTILQWSFVREDQPRRDTTRQIAQAIRGEVDDLQNAGVQAIQVDEPAIREGLPLREKDWQNYLDWAVESFRLAVGAARSETQVHTHMCYSEFGDIIQAIADLDADVITIEAARSKMELLADFSDKARPNEIGPGLYDIHSPALPGKHELEKRLRDSLEVFRPEQLWANPDCGLKTRTWSQVLPALAAMVGAAKTVREGIDLNV